MVEVLQVARRRVCRRRLVTLRRSERLWKKGLETVLEDEDVHEFD